MRDPLVIIFRTVGNQWRVIDVKYSVVIRHCRYNAQYLFRSGDLITLVGLITKHGILMCEWQKNSNYCSAKIVLAISYAAKVRLRPDSDDHRRNDRRFDSVTLRKRCRCGIPI